MKEQFGTCPNSFGVSLEAAREKARDKEQNKSNQGIFSRRDVWRKINKNSLGSLLCPILNRHRINAQEQQHA